MHISQTIGVAPQGPTQTAADTAALSAEHAASERTLGKVFRRVLPIVFICYVISYLDRTNIGFAALTMNRDLGLASVQFGLGAGLFAIGYFFFEIPSNLMMQKVGARLWIARIMITWGVISMLTAFVVGPKSFAAARFLLGIAEAGFTPGIYLYFTFWFPGKWRAKATAMFLVAMPVASIIGSSISGAILQAGGMHGLHGLHGCQWLLLLEALPAVIMGLVCWLVLADGPEKAKWLTTEEKAMLSFRLAAEQKSIAAKHGATLRDAMTNWRVYVLALINFCAIVGSTGVGLWMPQIIRQFSSSHAVIGILTAVPYVIGACVMLVWAHLANRAKSRVPYVAGSMVVAALGIGCSVCTDIAWLKLIALCFTISGFLAYQATYWAMPSGFLTGRAAAGGLALIVSIGNLGGFFGPALVGYIKGISTDFMVPLLALTPVLLLGAAAMVWLGDPGEEDDENQHAAFDVKKV